MKSAVFNLTVRREEMKSALKKIEQDKTQNGVLISLIEKADEETIKGTYLDEYAEKLKDNIEDLNTQKKVLKEMIERLDNVLNYLKEHKEIKPILNDLLVNFGFQEIEEKEVNNG